jgi:peptidoglycan/xylan/chitin deacetylase (PgdA/CDA1 family)
MKDFVFKLLYTFGSAKILNSLKGNDSVTVLCLHKISEEDDYFFSPIRPHIFEKLIKYCLRNYTITTFADIEKKAKKPKLILSFDDGYSDFIDYALPVLTKYGIPCNHNLVNMCLNNNATIWTQQLNDIFNHLKKHEVTNEEIIVQSGCLFKTERPSWISYYIDFFKILLHLKRSEREDILDKLALKHSVKGNHRMMTWEDAILLKDRYGVEIGSHSYHHDVLSTLDSKTELDEEIGKSITELEHRLNHKIEILALPNGQFNNEVLTYAQNIGIKHLLLVNDKINENVLSNNHLQKINRIGLVDETFPEMILRTELFHSKLRKTT